MSAEQPTLPYTPQRIALGIADHAYEKHVIQRREFDNPQYGPPLGINSKTQFAAHIVRVITGQDTRCFHSYNGRDLFHDPATNTTIIVNPNLDKQGKQLGGTCFRPETFERDWERLKNDEVARREHFKVKRAMRELVGGYQALERERLL